MNETLIADILYGSYIRYERLYEMTKYAFYGRTDSNTVNVYIDAYSIIRGIYKRGSAIQVDDSFAIASCLINLAIHLRAYFETRHRVSSKIYIIYGGARPKEALNLFPGYNEKNILMEDSNAFLQNLVRDNLEITQLLCQYLYDIFCIVNFENEFNVMASYVMDLNFKENRSEIAVPNIVYSKDQMSYQLVAFKPYTFLYRPMKSMAQDNSWVVTKSTLFAAYRKGELRLAKDRPTQLDVKMLSLFQAISGQRTRSFGSILNANQTLNLLEKAVSENVLANGYNANSILYMPGTLDSLISLYPSLNPVLIKSRFAALDLPYQESMRSVQLECMNITKNLVNLYNPQEIRNLNDQYFRKYPLDLNRV